MPLLWHYALYRCEVPLNQSNWPSPGGLRPPLAGGAPELRGAAPMGHNFFKKEKNRERTLSGKRGEASCIFDSYVEEL